MHLALAPMEGVVDHHFRQLLTTIGGIDYCTTEFIRITDTKLPSRVFHRLCPELSNQSKTEAGTPVKIQLLGSTPGAMAYHAEKAAQLGAYAIDLNFGCPAKAVNNSRGGACLLKEPETVFEIVRAVRESTPAEVPVSAKIRLGYDDRSLYMENALAVAEAGANEITVHARSKKDGYKPPAYWEYIREINQRLSIPVIANGEIWSVNDYIRCKEQTGCTRFMLGRGLLSTPDLARQIAAYQDNQTYPPMSWKDVCQLLHLYFTETRSLYPEKYAGNRVKQWLAYLRLQYPQANVFFDSIKRLVSSEDLEAAFTRALSELDKKHEEQPHEVAEAAV